MRKAIKGQITIFMALIFMVLFTLFTMTVSLSMFIHDKINLQNATDFASYYTASKQAELLGAIAHNNYVIRQSFKLLAYRYRVYGNGGRTDPTATNGEPLRHPAVSANYQNFYTDRNPYIAANGLPAYPPRVCVGAPHLFKDIIQGSTDNPCRRLDFSVGFINTVTSVVGGLVSGINSGVTIANDQVANSCAAIAYVNWWWANMIIAAHRLEQRDRRVIIDAIAANLARPIDPTDGGMVDIEGGNIYRGAYRTFYYNLTEANQRTIDEDPRPRDQKLRIVNSMEGYTPADWLKPILVNLLIPYSHYTTNGACSESIRYHVNGADTYNATNSGVVALRNRLDPNQLTLRLGNTAATRPNPYENITTGVEKNPWYMVYNKTETRIFSKPLFLGGYMNPDGITMQALSYAKPFGGRIGPWYRRVWSNGSVESDSGDRTDSRAPNRVSIGDYAVGINVADSTLFPNYSRFPTDQRGLTTNQAMVHAGPIIGWSTSAVGSTEVTPLTRLHDYARANYSYFSSDYNDPLAQNANTPGQLENSFNRRLEIAAIMPDAFDYTYYSISPNYYDYFIEAPDGTQKLSSWLSSLLPADVELRGDLGASENRRNFNITDQMFINDEVQARDLTTPGVTFSNLSRARDPIPYFFTENALALLTGWNKALGPTEYDVPTNGSMDDFFATCLQAFRGNGALADKPRVPSGCLRGGRFGYSVKFVSGDYIRESHPIGGDGATGNIVNPR